MKLIKVALKNIVYAGESTLIISNTSARDAELIIQNVSKNVLNFQMMVRIVLIYAKVITNVVKKSIAQRNLTEKNAGNVDLYTNIA